MQINTTQLKLEQFFSDYTQHFQTALSGPTPDLTAISNAFSEHFISATPTGIEPGEKGEDFDRTLEQTYAYYRQSGMRSIKIGALNLIPLDDMHWMAKVGWESVYRKPDGSDVPINFEVIYLVQMLNDGQPRIFAFISGDEQQALRDAGLIPEDQTLSDQNGRDKRGDLT